MHHEAPQLDNLRGTRSVPANLRRLERYIRIEKGKRPKHFKVKSERIRIQAASRGMQKFLLTWNGGKRVSTVLTGVSTHEVIGGRVVEVKRAIDGRVAKDLLNEQKRKKKGKKIWRPISQLCPS